MTAFQIIASMEARNVLRRLRRTVAGIVALAAALLPAGAVGMDLSPKSHPGTASLLLPPVLNPSPWMEWKPAPPVLKTDTLLAPDGVPEKNLRIPFEYERTIPRIS